MTRARSKTDAQRDIFVRLGAGGPAPGPRQVALVPGGAVPTLPLDLPVKLVGAAREQVARRQVTDMTGLEGDQLNIRPFPGSKSSAHWSRMLMANAADVAGWRAQAPEARAVLPDYLALPTAPGLWTVQAKDGDVQVRLGPGDGFTANPMLAEILMARALGDAALADTPKAVLVLSEPEGGIIASTLKPVSEAGDIPVVHDVDALAAVNLPVPKVLGHGELALDLRRDPYTTRARLRAQVLPWRWPMLVGALAAGLWTAAQVITIDRIEAQRRALSAETTALVRTHFVPVGPILDIRTQVIRALAQDADTDAETPADLLDVFGRAAQVLADQSARPQFIRYNQTDGLQVTVGVSGFAALEALIAAMADADLAVTLTRSRASDEGAEADMVVADAAAVLPGAQQ